jgi:phosphatidylserine/phosphatidylglycerophosphate/cardiolipin synthase-like enzyme
MTLRTTTQIASWAIATAAVAWIAAAATLNAADISVYFSPSVNTLTHTISTIDAATQSIDVAMYYCTNLACRSALVRAQNRGVTIRVLLDRSQRNRTGTSYEWLRLHNVDARIDAHEKLFHNKYAVIDSATVLIGSTNWTDNAFTKNAEAMVQIDDPTTASTFTANFAEHWAHATPPYQAQPRPTDQTEPSVISRQPRCPRFKRSHHHGTSRRTAIFLGSLRHDR